ncbi:MAG: hypothetical protein RSA86_07470 [Christensenellaceae bacterium]
MKRFIAVLLIMGLLAAGGCALDSRVITKVETTIPDAPPVVE